MCFLSAILNKKLFMFCVGFVRVPETNIFWICFSCRKKNDRTAVSIHKRHRKLNFPSKSVRGSTVRRRRPSPARPGASRRRVHVAHGCELADAQPRLVRDVEHAALGLAVLAVDACRAERCKPTVAKEDQTHRGSAASCRCTASGSRTVPTPSGSWSFLRLADRNIPGVC